MHFIPYFGYFWVLPFAVAIIFNAIMKKRRKKLEDETGLDEIQEFTEESESLG